MIGDNFPEQEGHSPSGYIEGIIDCINAMDAVLQAHENKYREQKITEFKN